jgi:hypothetical protein
MFLIRLGAAGLTLAAPSWTSVVLFSDLGPAGNVYNCCQGESVSGSGATLMSVTSANGFNSSGGGSVSQIDLAVSLFNGGDPFYASIRTDVSGLPGAQVPGARWDNLVPAESASHCCGLVTIGGISGVVLAPRTEYFMVLGPAKTSDNTLLGWNSNDQGVDGPDAYSYNGGSSWQSGGTGVTGAFDILGAASVPEPSTFPISALLTGMLGLKMIGRRVAR